MKFKYNPFQLYPVRSDQLQNLYINREKELQIIRSVLDTAFEKPDEVIPILGDQGSGKSSTLAYVKRIAKKKGFSVASYTTDDDYLSSEIYKNAEVILLDDLDKADDKTNLIFYRKVERLIAQTKFIYFTDGYKRKDDILKQRQSVISQKVPLTRLDKEKLTDILKERMINCLKEDDDFKFPFTDESMELASQRASNNLRAFIKYSKNAWTLTDDQKNITKKDVRESIIMEDKIYLKSLSSDELKVIWYATVGEFNLGYMTNLCDISRPTLTKKIKESNLLYKQRSGMETIVRSIYKDLDGGKEILRKMLDDMGVDVDNI